jgi:hypothetical protein
MALQRSLAFLYFLLVTDYVKLVLLKINFLDVINCPDSDLKHEVSETGIFFRPQVKPTLLGAVGMR